MTLRSQEITAYLERLTLTLLPVDETGKKFAIYGGDLAEVARLRSSDERSQAAGRLMAHAPELRDSLHIAADLLSQCARECLECDYGDGSTGHDRDKDGPCESCRPIREAESRARKALSEVARG